MRTARGRVRWGWLFVAAAILLFFWATRDVLPPFLAGLVIAYLLDPLTDRLQRRGLPRWLATFVVLIAFFAALAGLIVLIAPLFVAQLQQLIAGLPELVEELRPLVAELYREAGLLFDVDAVLTDIGQRAAEWAAGAARDILATSLALFSIVAILIIMPVVAFYSLRDFDDLTARARGYIPPRYWPQAAAFIADSDRALGGFIRGQSIVCLVLAVFYAAGWGLVGLDYALVLGLIAGILAFVPYLGAFVSVALALLVGVGQFGFDAFRLLLIFAVFQGGQILEGSVLTPNLIGGRIGLHPLWVLFAVFAGGEIAGLWGVFLAVPVAAVLGVLVRQVMAAYRRSDIYGPPSPPPAIT